MARNATKLSAMDVHSLLALRTEVDNKLSEKRREMENARDEFQLAATVQNLKTIARHLWRPPPNRLAHCEA